MGENPVSDLWLQRASTYLWVVSLVTFSLANLVLYQHEAASSQGFHLQKQEDPGGQQLVIYF